MVGEPQCDLESLYEQEFGYVWTNLRRLGIDEADVEDALQEVFVVAHKRLDTLEDPTLGRAWLFGVARNVARHYHRGRTRRRRFLERLAHEPKPDEDGRQLLEHVAAARYLEAFLDTLDAPMREVFVLVELEQLRGRELAEAVGISEAAAWSRLRRVRRAFERHFAELDFDVAYDDVARSRFLARASEHRVPDPASRVRMRGVLAPALGWGLPGTLSVRGGTLGTGATAMAIKSFTATVAATAVLGFGARLVFAPPPETTETTVVRPRGEGSGGAERVATRVQRPQGHEASATTPTPAPVVAVPKVRAQPRRIGSTEATTPDPSPPRAAVVQHATSQFELERRLADEVERLVHAGHNDAAMRKSVEYLSRFSGGRFEARVRSLRVALFCRDGHQSMARTERRLFLAASPDEATRRAPWLACVQADEGPSPAQRQAMSDAFDEL